MSDNPLIPDEEVTPDDFDFADRDFEQVVDEMPDITFQLIEDRYGEVTEETAAQASAEFLNEMREYSEQFQEVDKMEFELSSEEREWRDAFEYLGELLGEEVSEVVCPNCTEPMMPSSDEAHISQDGIVYSDCSQCGEEQLEDRYGRKWIDRRKVMSANPEAVEEQYNPFMWEDDDPPSATVTTPREIMSDDIKRQL